MTGNTQKLSLEDMLDVELDDLKDLPSYEAWPAGFIEFDITLGKKKFKEGTAEENEVLVADLVFVCMVELAAGQDPDTVLPKEGDKTQIMYDLTREGGQGSFKKLLLCLKDSSLGTSNARAALEDLRLPVRVSGAISSRLSKGKDGKQDRTYNAIETLVVQ